MISKRLLFPLLLSMLLHALLLTLPGFASRPLAGGGGERFAVRADSASGRLTVSLRVLDPTVPTLPPEEPLPDPAAEEQSSAADPSAAAGDLAQAVTEAAAGDEAGPKSMAAEVPLPILPDELPRGFDRSAYLAADELDVRPKSLHPIVIPFDDTSGIDRSRGEVVVVLFIGADGHVDLVDIERSDVPSAVSTIVADTFRAARMRPGIKSERPVPARMKVLVEFEVR